MKSFDFKNSHYKKGSHLPILTADSQMQSQFWIMEDLLEDLLAKVVSLSKNKFSACAVFFLRLM
jgi:hypothetical protein